MAVERLPGVMGSEGMGGWKDPGAASPGEVSGPRPRDRSSPAFSSQDEQERPPVDEEVLRGALAKLEEMSRVFGRHLRFELKRDPNLVQVSVIDSSTEEVVRKIPPDEVVRMIEQVDQMIGVLFDRSA